MRLDAQLLGLYLGLWGVFTLLMRLWYAESPARCNLFS